MNHGEDNLVGVVPPPDEADHYAVGQSSTNRQGEPSPTAELDRGTYLGVGRTLLPRWVRIVRPTPWFTDPAWMRSREACEPASLYRRQAATLAIAVMCEFEPPGADDPYLREVVRTSLIHWQLALKGDGYPLSRRLRTDPLYGAVFASVVQVLCESTGFHNGSLLSDIGCHIQWLSRRPPSAPWIEAATICGMADAAVLLRDKSLLGRARERLEALLTLQDAEGWFPELGGADIGCLSLTVDALARLGFQNEWQEVEEPLTRALRFLVHFVHPDGSAGGCYGTRGTGFLTPYGVELLAPRFPEAASLAQTCRQQCRHFGAERLVSLPDDPVAIWGSSLMLAAAAAQSKLPRPDNYPCDTAGHCRFPHAGISIFSTSTYYAVVNQRKGGALRVTFRNGAPSLIDSGVTVVSSRRIRTSASGGAHTQQRVTGSSVVCSGKLRRPGSPHDTRLHWLPRLIDKTVRRWRRWLSRQPRTSSPPDSPRGRRRMHDSHRREITFGSDWIEIRDDIHCRRRCESVVCQSDPPSSSSLPLESVTPDQMRRCPIVTRGGRDVRITRRYVDGRQVDTDGRNGPSLTLTA